MLGLLLTVLAIYWFYAKKFHSSLMIFFLLLTNGFQIVPVKLLTAGVPLEKSSDFAVLYVIVLGWILRGSLRKILFNFPVFKYSLCIVAFVFLDACYSYFGLNYSVVNILQVFRPYLFFLSFLIFFYVPLPVLMKVLKHLCVITIFQGVLFIFQILTGKPLLLSASGLENVTTNVMGGYIRFYNTPVFLNVFFFYLTFIYKFKSKWMQYLSLAILVLTVVGPMHRSLIIAMVAVCSIYILIRQSVSRKVGYMAFLGLFLYAASFVGIFNARMNEAFNDLQSTFSSNLNLDNIDIQENTTMFRIGHLVERVDYVAQSPTRWLFGIGLISDNSSNASRLPFVFGLTSDVTGQVVQIDSSDLIWSPLILNLGFLGTIIYAVCIAMFLVFFYKLRSISKYSSLGFLVITLAFLISMMGVEMISISFRVIVMYIAVIVSKDCYHNHSQGKSSNQHESPLPNVKNTRLIY